MEKLNFRNHKQKKSKHNFAWQELAEEMTIHFRTSCFWIFWKYPERIIRTEFGACKLEGIFELRILLFKLNKYRK